MAKWRRIFSIRKGALCAFFCFCALRGAAQTGFDTGLRARELLSELKAAPELSPTSAQWLRVRGVAEPGNWWSVWLERRALKGIRARGQQVCVFVMPGRLTWKSGTRLGKNGSLPLDLREAYQWGLRLGKTYGDLVDAWEIGNEPDIGFLPENAENYAAYLKACYLGIKAGAVAAGRQKEEGGPRSVAHAISGKGADGGAPTAELSTFNPQPSTSARDPLVLMAPLALPPGPYFEALTRNGVLSYTDGFNYHYYGYAEDFSGVYRQFEEAVTTDDGRRTTDDGGRTAESGRRMAEDGGRMTDGGRRRAEDVSQMSDVDYQTSVIGRQSSAFTRDRRLPVFLTEYGYGTLSGAAAGTVGGRVRQWQWFRDVGAQIGRLRIEGPMAFYLPPYLESGTQEFGLTIAGVRNATTKHTKNTKVSVDAEKGSTFTSGGLEFHPADFGRDEVRPWMKFIGRRIGDNEASPALAWLLGEGANKSSPSRDWQVDAHPASPIVIDFVAGSGMLAVKQCQGYFLSGAAGDSSVGEGELRIYNFGRAVVSGRLDLGPMAEFVDAGADVRSIAPGQMLAIPLKLKMRADDLLPHTWSARFLPKEAILPTSIFATQLYADASHMPRRILTDLGAGEAGSQNAQAMDTRKFAHEEPPETKSGGWRFTKGVEIVERDGAWNFTVTGFPSEPLRPAIAEWVLPDGFQMPEGSLLEFEYRLATRTSDDCAPVPEPRAPVQIASVGRELLGLSLRTENGNLYTVWQTPPATNTWQKYAQAKGSFTMGFYGRANLPWRFADNRPIALVFTFRPNFLPATFEVKNVVITSYGRP